MSQSELGLGCWQFAGTFGFWDGQPREDSIRTIHAALRGGVRHFDTAQGYGNGRSEQMLGQQLKRFYGEFPRDRITIATKIMPMSPQKIRKAVETSLGRLCTPYIDILYIHWPDANADTLPMLDAMQRLKEEGSIRNIGLSNFPPDMLEQIYDSTPFDWVQCPGSLLWIRNLAATFKFCETHGIRSAIYSPLGMGLLSGRYHASADLPEKDARRNLFCFQPDCITEWSSLVEILVHDSEKLSCSPSQLALSWILSQGSTVVVSGSRNKAQFAENLSAIDMDVPQEIIDDLSTAAKSLERKIPSEQDNPFGHVW